MSSSLNQLYLPSYTLKQLAPDVFIADGDVVSFYGLPFTTRMTVIRFFDGSLWVHSPIALKGGLEEELKHLGQIKYLIAPNKIHYWYLDEMQQAFPKAQVLVAPGTAERAVKYGKTIRNTQQISQNYLPSNWPNEIEVVEFSSKFMTELEFFHIPSKTLILTDIFENFEPQKIGWTFRQIARLGGVLSPNGGTSLDQRFMYLTNNSKDELRNKVNTLLSRKPERIILPHGKIITENAVRELERVFSWVLD